MPMLTTDPVELLDHRTHLRLIPAERAEHGRYLAIDGGDGKWLLPLRRRANHIGRGPGADLRIDDLRVSRLHAIINHLPDEVHILDSRSLNGTFVNGQRIVAARLHHGDVVRVGPLTLRYVEVPAQVQALNATGSGSSLAA